MRRPRRKRLLQFLGLAAVVLLGVALWKGVRYPPLQWEPPAAQTTGFAEGGFRVRAEGAFVVSDGERIVVRASTPQPRLRVSAMRDAVGELELQNLHPEAVIEVLPGEGGESWPVTRTEDGAVVEVRLARGRVGEVSVVFPERERFVFAAIGDAGGRDELAWCLKRAHEFGADFVLHLGDIAYLAGDYEQAVEHFESSPIPIFTAIGNHDFHGGHRNRWRFFQEQFGPRNHWFTLGGVYFLNLDTAADLVPANRGRRGALLREFEAHLASRAEAQSLERFDPNLVVFTHRPFADPRVLEGLRDNPHALNRTREADWLRAKLLELGADHLFAGHIHASFHFDDQGLDTWIAGDGLGARGRKKAQILIGEYRAGEAPTLRFEPLNMPQTAKTRTPDGSQLLDHVAAPPR